MKIIYISDSIIPSRTANSIHVMKMCNAFVKLGHDVTLLTRKSTKFQEKGINNVHDYYGVNSALKIKKLIFLDKIIGKGFLYGLCSIFHILKNKPDLIYCRSIESCFLASFLKYNLIYEVHAPISKSNFINTYIINKISKNPNFQKLVVISNSLKNIYLNNWKIKNILLAPDASDEINDFRPLSKWPGRKNKIQVGYFGHLYRGRGIELIIELATKIPDMDFHIIGGTTDDIVCWNKKCSNDNLFLHGYVQPNLVYKYRNNCDILLAPYQNEVAVNGNSNSDTSKFMSPLKIFEYMANKRVIVASDLPAIREILNENNSVLVTYNDINQWIKALNKLQNSNLRKTLVFNAYNDFIKNYSWDIRAQNVLSG